MTQAASNMIGHNNPPSDPDIMREMLAENNAKALKRAEALIEAADRVPAELTDQETADKVTDLEKQITVCWKALEEGRVKDKAPYLALCRTVDDFFKGPGDNLMGAKTRLKGIQTKWLVKAQEAERKRREELAEQQRQEAERQAAEAAKLEADGKHSAAEAQLEKAMQAEQQGNFFAGAAQDRGAAIARSTGEMTGAKSSLRYVWTGEIIDREQIDLKKLLPYLSNDVLQKAINQFVKAGGKELAGVKIWEKPESTTR